ncbi:MAG: class I SAM-dependent methyltransferase [Planctomycetota bacterium]
MKNTPMKFWDGVAAEYDAGVVKGPNYAARLDRAAGWLGADANVLDVGCAGGHITIDLASRVGRIHGIDLSPKLIAIAERRAASQGVENATFAATTADDPGLVEGGYDGITAYSVLHLVDDAAATLKRSHALLRPGGALIAEVPCREDIPWYFRLIIPAMTLIGKAPVVWLYPQAEYEAMFRAAGFTIEEIEVYNPKSHSRSVLARKAG